jgi:hypothetical protein
VTRSRPSAVTFAVAYVIIYVTAVVKNLALFTYHPELNQFGPLVQPPISGPAMYWYGWLATAGLGALAISAIAAQLPGRWSAKLWSGWSWAVPMAAILTVVYILRGYFLR